MAVWVPSKAWGVRAGQGGGLSPSWSSWWCCPCREHQTGTSWRELNFRKGCEGCNIKLLPLYMSRNSDLEQKCHRNESLPISSHFYCLCYFLLCFQAALTLAGPIPTSFLEQLYKPTALTHVAPEFSPSWRISETSFPEFKMKQEQDCCAAAGVNLAPDTFPS